MIFYILTYLTYRIFYLGNVVASPIVSHYSSLETRSILYGYNVTFANSSFAIDNATSCNFNQRSALDIVWSCISTLFLCTWTIVHPNVPGPDEESWKILWRRLRTMYWCIIAPELVVSWAIRQFLGARHILKKYRDSNTSWTMKHAHFLQMGGFYLISEEYSGVLYPDKFDDLTSQKVIPFPSVAEANIEDKSKADVLSKIIVLTQTLWFVIQCIGRLSQGLELAKLEVATLAVISSTLILSIMWWDKPFDVRRPIYLQSSFRFDQRESLISTPRIVVNDDSTDAARIHPADDGVSEDITVAGDEFLVSQQEHTGSMEQQISASGNPANVEHSSLEKNHPINYRQLVAQRTVLLWRCLWSRVLFFIPVLGNTSCSICKAIYSSLAESLKTNGSLGTLYNLIYSWPLALQISKFLALDDSPNPLPSSGRVSSYFAATAGNSESLEELLTLCGIIFGSILCIAWSSHFPSATEKLLWRFSTGIMLISAVSFQIALQMTGKHGVHFDGHLFSGILWAGFTVITYLIARHYLLVGAFMSLRALPPSVLQTISWSNFLPHF